MLISKNGGFLLNVAHCNGKKYNKVIMVYRGQSCNGQKIGQMNSDELTTPGLLVFLTLAAFYITETILITWPYADLCREKCCAERDRRDGPCADNATQAIKP